MDLTVTTGMQQDQVVRFIATTVHLPNDMVIVPTGLFGNELLTDWTDAKLFMPLA